MKVNLFALLDDRLAKEAARVGGLFHFIARIGG